MKSEQEIIEYFNTLMKEKEDFDKEEVTWSDGEMFNRYNPDDIDTADRINVEDSKFHNQIGMLKWILEYQNYDDHVILAEVVNRIKNRGF